MCIRYRLLVMLGAVLLCGCVSSIDQVTKTDQSAVQMRSYQQRAFDTADKEQTLRSVIATLQDLDFVLDKADLDLGMVTATKLSGYQLRITVTVRPRGDAQMLVRANAGYGEEAVKDLKFYRDFFTALEKAMFLTAHEVD
jgi:cell division protein FtsB